MADGPGKERRRAMNNVFSNDLLLEILHRIPAKSAVRCKAVCKRWRNLISTHFFMDLFCSHHPLREGKEECLATGCSTKIHMFLIHPHFEPDFSLDFLPFFEAAKDSKFILGFSNGLLLCNPDPKDQIFYYICNPITKNWVSLPAAPAVHEDLDISVGFAHYPDLSCPGFKIVRVLPPLNTKPVSDFEVDIFCSWTGTWTRRTVTSPKPITWVRLVVLPPAVFYRGCLHWLIRDFHTIVYDVKNDKINFIVDRPNGLVEFWGMDLYGFSLCGGLFYVAQLHYTVLIIWQLNHNEWTMKRKVNLEEESSIRFGREWLMCLSTPCQNLLLHPYDIDVFYV
ncbi:unnamed protein product, partial [Cuscuta epithymum]